MKFFIYGKSHLALMGISIILMLGSPSLAESQSDLGKTSLKSSLPNIPEVKIQPRQKAAEIAIGVIAVRPTRAMPVQSARHLIKETYVNAAKKTVEEIVKKSVEMKLEQDTVKLKAFRWDSEEQKIQKQEEVRKLNNWYIETHNEAGQKAREWQPSGNWRDSKINIKTGPAYQQLKSISIHGW